MFKAKWPSRWTPINEKQYFVEFNILTLTLNYVLIINIVFSENFKSEKKVVPFCLTIKSGPPYIITQKLIEFNNLWSRKQINIARTPVLHTYFY